MQRLYRAIFKHVRYVPLIIHLYQYHHLYIFVDIIQRITFLFDNVFHADYFGYRRLERSGFRNLKKIFYFRYSTFVWK